MKYAAINIGPILKTLGMARKINELWCASYLFSFLMKCIVEEIKKHQGIEIISPDIKAIEEAEFKEVGIYPDRIYLKGDVLTDEFMMGIEDKALATFHLYTGINQGYVNVMWLIVERDSFEGTLNELNQKLDTLELYNRQTHKDDRDITRALLQLKKDNILFYNAFNKVKISGLKIEKITNTQESKPPKEKKFSYNNYLCIVQADGDGMGKIVTASGEQELKKVSGGLVNFGIQAAKEIKEYGGVPVYAGGDDLLFLAPVVSQNGKNIFDLIKGLDTLYEEHVQSKVEGMGRTTMSYGLSITYYKYPLYEALKTAGNQLFGKAKTGGKNHIAWSLKKHSGSGMEQQDGSGNGFEGLITKDNSEESLYTLFRELFTLEGGNEKVISAIAHKLRGYELLIQLIRKDEEHLSQRLEAFYKTALTELSTDSPYIKHTRKLLETLLREKGEPLDIEKMPAIMYGMLRTAKFIQGEEVKQ